jgi:muramoyltetrapeptide carboxypeptidase
MTTVQVAARAPTADVDWIQPPRLEHGAVVRVIAPSGPFEPRLVLRAMGWLTERYVVRWDRRIFSRHGYLAGDDDRRREELSSALAEADVGAIFCARGGYGGNRFVHDVDWSALRASPRWLVGFSDVTALHIEAMHVRVASIHGPNLTGLGRGDAQARDVVVELLERGPCRNYQLDIARAGASARGPLCGGNLSLLHSCAAAGRLALPRGAVLLIEEVGERPYRIDRMLTTLMVGGHLHGVSAVVVGDLDACNPGADGVTALETMVACLAPLGVPIHSGLPSGHAARNDALILGATVTVTTDGMLVTKTRAGAS